MDAIWSILGVVAAIVAGVVILLVILLLSTIKKLSQFTSRPTEIHLKLAADHKWKNMDKHETAASFMKEQGFSDVGVFLVEEMPGVVVHGFVKPADGQISVIYEHPKVEHWIDFVAFFTDGGALTASNAPQGGELDHKPGQEKFYLPNESTQTVFEKFVAQTCRSARTAKTLGASAQDFVELFEKGYREEQEWRNAKGGPTESEIRRVAAVSGMEVNDEIIEQSRRIEERKAYEGLCKTLTEKLRASHADSAKFNYDQSELVFIHDNLSATMLREIFHRSKDYGDMGARVTDMEPARATFKTWNAKLPAADSFQKIAELEEPVKVDVYKIPLYRAKSDSPGNLH